MSLYQQSLQAIPKNLLASCVTPPVLLVIRKTKICAQDASKALNLTETRKNVLFSVQLPLSAFTSP